MQKRLFNADLKEILSIHQTLMAIQCRVFVVLLSIPPPAKICLLLDVGIFQ